MHTLEKINKIALLLKKEGIPDSEKEAELIIANVTGIDKLSMLRDNPLINELDAGRIDASVTRRLKREPLQYILGSVEFHGLTIRVGRGVLVPRPETEQLVEEVLKTGTGDLALGVGENAKVLDLCCGSGCMALAIAQKMPNAEVYATDISDVALEYAGKNAQINGIGNVTFLAGDLFGPVEDMMFHSIVSNPPYIRTEDIPTLQEEIVRWEPHRALDGGKDGLRYYREIIENLEQHLFKEGKCFLEIGFDQRVDIESLAHASGLKSTFKKDLSGHDRIAVLSF